MKKISGKLFFFPGEAQYQGSWFIDFSQTEEGVGFQVQVDVDSSPCGLETLDDLWNSYDDEYEAAIQAQNERQREALAILQELETALDSMVSGQG